MGIKDFFGGKQGGWQCEKNPDGVSRTCTRFEVVDGQRVATGTVVTLTPDPTTCDVAIGGDVSSMMDKDLEDINKIAKSMKQGCTRGIA